MLQITICPLNTCVTIAIAIFEIANTTAFFTSFRNTHETLLLFFVKARASLGLDVLVSCEDAITCRARGTRQVLLISGGVCVIVQ